MQPLPQSSCPLGHLQAPSLQVFPTVQAFSQLPQWASLVLVSTQLPEQRACPLGQSLLRQKPSTQNKSFGQSRLLHKHSGHLRLRCNRCPSRRIARSWGPLRRHRFPICDRRTFVFRADTRPPVSFQRRENIPVLCHLRKGSLRPRSRCSCCRSHRKIQRSQGSSYHHKHPTRLFGRFEILLDRSLGSESGQCLGHPFRRNIRQNRYNKPAVDRLGMAAQGNSARCRRSIRCNRRLLCCRSPFWGFFPDTRAPGAIVLAGLEAGATRPKIHGLGFSGVAR